MSRRVDPRRTRIRIVEVDGTDCLVARNANQAMPSIVAVNANDVLADDWERSDTLDQIERDGNASATGRAKTGGDA
jgi:hypothetical protein